MTTIYPEILNATLKGYEEDFPLLMPRWGYVASAFVLFLIGFFGFFLNLMVILLMFKDRQLWTPLNIILFNLVCSDFSVSLLGNPFTLISALFHRWIFGPTMCVLYGFFMALLGITSITTLTVISFERYLMVTRPLSSRHLSSKGAVLSILFIWTYSLALTTPPLMGWGSYVNEAANISCSVNWHEQSMNTLTYILFLFAMGQIVPFAIITFSYVNIIRTMKKNSQRLGRVSRAEARATYMVFIMIIAFTVAWTPYSVFALMEQFAKDGIVSPGAGVIPALVAKSSICYDPLIYVGMNSQFRQSIKRVFGVHSKGRNQLGRKYNNTFTTPARMTSIKDITTKYNSEYSSSANKKRDKKFIIEDVSEVTNNEINRQYARTTELCTIQENKTGSDAERSGDTMCDEDSSNGQRKMYLPNDSTMLLSERSPTLKFLDSQRMAFIKNPKNKEIDVDTILNNIYGNDAYEDHATDVVKVNTQEHATDVVKVNTQEGKVKLNIKHSCSLDLGGSPQENKIRKLSIETKLENLTQPIGSLKDTVISKFFEQNLKQNQESFKSYLCSVENATGGGEIL